MSWDREFEGESDAISAGGGLIYVAPQGNDGGKGTLFSPLKTIAKAKLLVSASRKIIAVRGGSYVESFTWPNLSGVKIACIDGPGLASFRGASGAAYVVSVDPEKSAGTWEMTLQGIDLSHRTGTVGLQVDNAKVGKRINLILKNLSTNAEGTGNSIDVNRTGAATDAIRMYMDGQNETIEGLIHYITELADDRIRINGYRLIGGLTVAGAVGCEVTLLGCGMKTGGITTDGANNVNTIGCWYETDENPNVYTNYANAFDT